METVWRGGDRPSRFRLTTMHKPNPRSSDWKAPSGQQRIALLALSLGLSVVAPFSTAAARIAPDVTAILHPPEETQIATWLRAGDHDGPAFVPQATIANLALEFAIGLTRRDLPMPFEDSEETIDSAPVAEREDPSPQPAQAMGDLGAPTPKSVDLSLRLETAFAQSKPAPIAHLSDTLRKALVERFAKTRARFTAHVVGPLNALPAAAQAAPIVTNSLAQPTGKQAVRLTPHRIAYLAEPETVQKVKPLPLIDHPVKPQLEPVFPRIRLVKAARVLDPSTLETEGFQIRLVGYDLPESQAICQRIDGVNESCHLRIATVLELLIRNRNLVCRYQQPEGFALAYGHCQVGSADLSDLLVRRGLVKRNALAASASDIQAKAEVPDRQEKPMPQPVEVPPSRNIAPKKAPKALQVAVSWPSGPHGPKVVSIVTPQHRNTAVVTRQPLGAGGPHLISIRKTPEPRKAAATKLAKPAARVHDLSKPRFIRFADVKP